MKKMGREIWSESASKKKEEREKEKEKERERERVTTKEQKYVMYFTGQTPARQELRKQKSMIKSSR